MEEKKADPLAASMKEILDGLELRCGELDLLAVLDSQAVAEYYNTGDKIEQMNGRLAERLGPAEMELVEELMDLTAGREHELTEGAYRLGLGDGLRLLTAFPGSGSVTDHKAG